MQNIFLKPLRETNAISVLVLVKTGSRYENEKNNGVAHFIEHLLFKGTKKRPNSLFISKELDGVGADYNAFTAKDKTGYYIKASKEYLELALDILSDMIFNSKFDNIEIERERGVIIEEINMYNDNPLINMDSLIEESVFFGHALGRQISGKVKNLQSISREDILKFYKKYYKRENMLIGISGNFDENIAKRLIDKYFKITNFDNAKNFDVFNLSQKSTRIKLIEKNTDQIHLAIGFPGLKYEDKYDKALELLSVILGGNMSSRLFLKIREKLGLCYYIRCENSNYEDTGIFSILTGLDKSRIEEAIKNIFKEINKFLEKGVTDSELKMAKEFLRGKLMLRMEDSMNVIAFYCKQLLLKSEYKNIEEIISEFDKVTKQDIITVGKKIFRKDKINFAVISPHKDKKYFEDLINKYY
ncbi:MAG TPA: pitrilysin family protein [bacterium]|jgi:predicted Zn-dependent peptidase|nr:pitrilysin family protein [bacterium]HOG38350.1 pitrilysin family protein [bacterium]HQI03252.1 pitrilysin family protein [bacterium]